MSRLANPSFWAGKRVLLTGHTGFKGSWARLWLTQMGALVTGYALPPAAEPSLYALLGSGEAAGEHLCDIRSGDALAAAFRQCDPEIILHMAAQPLVRESYRTPAETFDINVMGTVRLLDAARAAPALKAIVVVTTDKVYRNDESGRHFPEDAVLGGHDPYSGSKAACELVVSTWRDSFLHERGVQMATARGGNVLGGGDFSVDRLVPDIVRAAQSGKTLDIRSPMATRPWQHVLDCLNGYFVFAEALHAGETNVSALNFGPSPTERQIPVQDVARAIQTAMGLPTEWRDTSSEQQPREMMTLGLDPALAARTLSWSARLSQDEAIDWAARWYDGWRRGTDARDLTLSQIDAFMRG
ncbi:MULTISPECIES: CDP-glucose 4,6-dehydratase [unclassified Ensifer]|uniref:CDP-glucose 4,6-dehydratase n=1 Tax=unclassified Ensifer TaxID=2633371 RepID=UPI00081325EF|nr:MULTISPECIES: CDP-glucose 4,6-dehydratase [unclassified Ensifer]OCP02335.1 CDP-glucose 4,6-dehydratase [Ensifer sp. LC14]OCP14180.1 CDP-glucose 4,6-dehydratase [Ensifer sp. LC13]OCP14856.1 CDP-glucose 4,6-dehydratase [Ensifer sp. LC11]OCP34343.1 CDP-glucose 4,6-dehydratase [Ensifer sp. LC499]